MADHNKLPSAPPASPEPDLAKPINLRSPMVISAIVGMVAFFLCFVLPHAREVVASLGTRA